MLDKVKSFLRICKESYRLLASAEPLILSSSTAFFTTFALSPVLVLLVSAFGLVFQSEMLRNRIFAKISSSIGSEASAEIQKIVSNFMAFETSWWISLLGIVFLLFVVTTLLGIMKANIHKLWRIRKTTRNIRNRFSERMRLVSIIFATGGLFMVSIFIDSALAFSLDYLQSVLPGFGIFIIRFLNVIFGVIIVSIWFTLIFKYLPQAVVEWDVAFNGAFITAVLFYVGRMALARILVHARIASIFGASASFALLLLFIFYASFIFYYGAAFTHEYGESIDKHICAGKHALEYEEKFIEDRTES